MQRIQRPSRNPRGRLRRALVVFVIAAVLPGCASFDYYGHLLAGQYRIWKDRQPIDELLDAGTLAPSLRERLAYAVRAREFAFDSLALPDNGSFRDYVDLGRPFVIWNVFATPALSLTPVQSCFPFAGCFSYRGFFTEERARRHARRLADEGFDVYVGGVSAYSTLGWLNDPVLSSIVMRDKSRIAEIIFHELAHERLYVPGDTTFNESFAMSVANAGLARWLPLHGSDFTEVERARLREEQFVRLVLETRAKLAAVFDSDAAPADKHAAKRAAYRELQQEYRQMKATWSGDDSYDAWIETDLNNAKLASVSTYHDHLGAFMTILARHDDDLPAFYESVGRLAELPQQERDACLEALSTTTTTIGACAGAFPAP